MEEAILFIEANQSWIYLVLVLLAVIYSWLLLQAYQSLRGAVFGLERERAISRLTRAGAMLALIASGILATFVITTFAGPAIPPGLRPTPMPTVSLLATSAPEGSAQGEPGASPTPLTVDMIDGSGCENPEATITSPDSGEAVRGEVELLGTANVTGFAFYKLEYHDLKAGSDWLAISASNQPVCEGCAEEEFLGVWDTSLVTPGQYAIQLVVTDTLGNAPLPCQILVQVTP
ncbi:MAG: hypothetical protein PVF85_04725 [Anaerolineales bacterium]|jgi:hypothetical protein